jgi:hypothetical protein
MHTTLVFSIFILISVLIFKGNGGKFLSETYMMGRLLWLHLVNGSNTLASEYFFSNLDTFLFIGDWK